MIVIGFKLVVLNISYFFNIKIAASLNGTIINYKGLFTYYVSHQGGGVENKPISDFSEMWEGG